MLGPPEAYASLLRARRGYLGTNGSDGTADVVPVCFTWAGEAIWIPVDPGASLLSRRRSAEGGPKVTFMVDRWDEDWSRLSWLVAKGRVTVLNDQDDEEYGRSMAALESKYPQYLSNPHEGPIVRLDVEEWTGWDALDHEPTVQ